jgi:hypothetical protein
MKTMAEDAEDKSSWLIMETSSFRVRWDIAMFFVLCYVALSVPMRIGFSVEAEGLFYSFELIIEVH